MAHDERLTERVRSQLAATWRSRSWVTPKG
jgi:hypothetical protein